MTRERSATASLLAATLAGALGNCVEAGIVCAQGAATVAPVPMRPNIMFNRWQENWSVLADPAMPPEPLDALKYIPLSPTDPETYLFFGTNLRERYEGNDAASFGTGGNHRQSYVISCTELHAYLHIGEHTQSFVQLQSNYAPWKTQPTPPDRNRLDLEQGFVALTEPVGDGTMKLRLGRQQFAFDVQRFVSVRDGPNVRLSHDAA